MVLSVDRLTFPPHIESAVGQQLEIPQTDGHKILFTVMDISGSNVTLDANHPLAGQDQTFDIQLMEII